MAAYLDIAAFKLRSVMPSEDIDAREAAQPGWLDVKLEEASRYVDARLGKRYAIPFASPAPDIVLRWVTHLVTFETYQRRGWDPGDKQADQIKEDSDTAKTEIREAADAVNGLFDLPLANGASGITRKGPLAYSEASPYVWTDEQGDRGHAEDRGRGGSSYG